MYTQSITRTHRTAIILAILQRKWTKDDKRDAIVDALKVLLIDRVRYLGQKYITKAEAVATITNDLLFELVERARRSDGVRDYYDIAVIGYSGDDEVYSLLPGGRELISVAELAAGEMGEDDDV